ncbi:MAG TPA: hypothetical protein EYG52_05925 [Pseudomonadales bacterium]|jgi:hypothetical protein|nr:hypothetical protein [Gammaproteobacteria bacterium]HIL83034.1 hypothetical protein [Pseudomonadales bacterium]
MSEVETTDVEARKKRDNSRLRKIAIRHAAIVLTAFTIWGTSDYWAAQSGLFLAEMVSLINAIFAGVILAYIFHEWGHFTGARISGAVSPVAKEPVSFFMFNFKDELNTRGQFLSMSVGGPFANWGLFVLIFLLLPLNTWSQAMLLATIFAIAVSVSVFEFPVINAVMYGEKPAETINKRQRESGNTPRTVGIIAGAALWLLTI